jgi:NADPH2:quinone reductase
MVSSTVPKSASAPVVAQRLPLAEARRAHEVLGRGGVTGKTVLVAGGVAVGVGA